jgi:predicted metal-dependent peptidase
MNCCDVTEKDAVQGLYNYYGISQTQVQWKANQGMIELPSAVVSTPLPNTKQAYHIQELKTQQSSTKVGTIKNGVVHNMRDVSNTVKLSSSFVEKNELLGAKSKNGLSELYLEKAQFMVA